MVSEEYINEVKRSLISKGFKLIAVCKGYLMEELIRPEMHPFIIFAHSESSLMNMKLILSSMGIPEKNFNDILRSKFDSKGELQWIVRVPNTIFKYESEDDFKRFWIMFEDAINSIK